ncbi:hypothetical protein GP486_006073 [Trichoglossum hirsutum]|uniref:Uncharacterized protein n=1 Tax=Trichoglossum hirsutum TaxID=265104 RepID=A0A9P8L830_9PEZI|nr:hypothetical protein GP486_006073 [Trichoglossum hirsutum]
MGVFFRMENFLSTERPGVSGSSFIWLSVIATAIAAGGTAAAAYLEAKFHIAKDIDLLTAYQRSLRAIQQAEKKKRASLWYLFEEQARQHPDRTCLWSRTGVYTWAEVLDISSRYAQWYISKGVKPTDLVAFYLQNSPEFVFAWLGLWAIGAAPAMINHHLRGDALMNCLEISGATLLLVDGGKTADIYALGDRLKDELGLTAVVLNDSTVEEILSNESRIPENSYRGSVTGNDAMGLLFTRSSEGVNRWYNCMPLYHGTGWFTATACLISGATLCIGKKFSITKFWDDVRDSEATIFVYVGEVARYLLAAPPSQRDKEHNVRSMCGNGLRPDVWEKFQERFGIAEVAEIFGSTEGVFNLMVVSRGGFLNNAVGHHGLIQRIILRNKYVPVAVDAATNTIVRDPKTGFAVRQPYSTGGEILVNIPYEAIFTGYYRNDNATQKKFERDVFRKGDLYYRTGDALRRSGDGRWYFVDRLGDTFRWKSENVSTTEVGVVLGRFPDVSEANVYGVLLPHHDGRAGCAAIYIDPAKRDGFDWAGLLQYAREKLPGYAVPIFVRVVRELRPSHNFKQLKVPLRNEGVDPVKAEKNGDRLMWVKPGGSTYEHFGLVEWNELDRGRAKL